MVKYQQDPQKAKENPCTCFESTCVAIERAVRPVRVERKVRKPGKMYVSPYRPDVMQM